MYKSSNADTIGKRIQYARKKAGLHQWELAGQARCAQYTISLLENDKGGTQFCIVAQIAKVLGVSLDWIAYGRSNVRRTLEHEEVREAA